MSQRGALPFTLATLFLRAHEHLQGSLRTKFIIVIVALEIALMGAVTLVVERDQHRAILEQARLQALSLGASLAALSEGYLLSYNFVQLEQVAEKVTADDEDVVYSVAHLRDGKVAAFSGRNDLQGKVLTDPISHRALQAKGALTQEIMMPQSVAQSCRDCLWHLACRLPGHANFEADRPIGGGSPPRCRGSVRTSH